MKDFESDELDAKLRAWKVEPQVPVSFQREVWQCIAARQAARDEALWPQLMQRLFTQIARPRYATSLIAISLSISLGVAHVHAQDTKARMAKLLESRYAASIDPLAMSR